MIEEMRKPKKSRSTVQYIVYGLIFAVIIATFIFMIPGMGGGTGTVNVAAEVGGASISLLDYNERLQAMRRQYSKMFNGEIPPIFEKALKNQVIDGLVRQEVFKQYANKEDIYVSKEEVADFIKRDLTWLQENGEFSLTRYNNFLKASNSTAHRFEEKIYKEILYRNFHELFSKGILKSKGEQDLNERLERTSLEFQYIDLSSEALKKVANVTDSEVEAYLGSEEGAKAVEQKFKDKGLVKEKESEETKPSIAREILIKKKFSQIKEKAIKIVKEEGEGKEQALLSLGLKWGKNEKFNLSSSQMPVFGESDKIFSKLASLSTGEIFPEVILNNGKNYIIKQTGVVVQSKNSSQSDKVNFQKETSKVGGRGLSILEILYQSEKQRLKVSQNLKI